MQKDELKKMSDSVMDLLHEAISPKKNTSEMLNRIRQDFGLSQNNMSNSSYNGITGSAAGINNKLAFENISIPYENAEKEKKQTVLKGYIQKSDDYLREINHELHKLENKKINLNISTSHKVMKKYNDFDRFKRLLSLVEALFYVLREDKYTNSTNKIQIFKNELKEELNNYDQLTYPKEKLNINDINTAFILFILDKNEGDIKRLILFLRCLVLWPLTNALLDKFYKRPDINITNKELDIKNEMRHITGLVFYTQKYGAEQARKYGYLKEKLDIFKEGDISDTFIDFENNERGIAFGIKYKNLNKDETIEKIYEEFIKPKRIIKN